MEISSMVVYINVSMNINMVKRFKYAKKYIDQDGVEVKTNQLFPDRAVWMADEQHWRYFKWEPIRWRGAV